VNVNKLIALGSLCMVAIAGAACGPAVEPTPTRTPKAAGENSGATQTPWIVYVQVTNTAEPSTVTPLPTIQLVAAQPTKAPPTKAPATRPPATKAPVLTAAPAEPPTAAPPTASPAPACGQPMTVAALTFPENGATRITKQNPGGNMAIEFKFTPAVGYPLDTNLGYMVLIKAKSNSASLFVSHNQFLKDQKVTLEQHAVWNLTLPTGDDANLTWTVTPVMSSGGFDDLNHTQPAGTITACGPSTGPWSIYLHVQDS
jgi:hypothetical protein